MPITYEQLVDVKGTIYSKQGKGYKSPAELATALGVAPYQIDWTKIAKSSTVPGATPTPTTQVPSDLAAFNQQMVAAPPPTTTIPSWEFSQIWDTTGEGKWRNKPVLDITEGGKTRNYFWETPQEYIDKMRELQSRGVSDPKLAQHIKELEAVLPEFERAGNLPVTPTTPTAPTPEVGAPGAPTTDTNIQSIQAVFGAEWQPSPAFTPELQEQGIYGAVRIAGRDEVYTLGPGGGWESAESFQEKFGTSDQEGIVGEVSIEQARQLGVQIEEGGEPVAGAAPTPGAVAPVVPGVPGASGPLGEGETWDDRWKQVQDFLEKQGEETPEEKKYREDQEATLKRLMDLAEDLAEAGRPSEELVNLRTAILQQQKVLADLTPTKYLETEPGLKAVGVTQAFLERRVAAERDPIASALSNMLISESLISQQIAGEKAGIQAQMEAAETVFGLRKEIAGLRPEAAELPAGVQSEMLKRFLWPKEEGDELLSVSEAKSLGVPYGTTKSQAAAMGITPAAPTPTPTPTPTVDYRNILYNVGLPVNIATTKGELTKGSLDKLVNAGMPVDTAQGIYDAIIQGYTLEDVRQYLRENGVDPAILDIFMMTLQGYKEGDELDALIEKYL